MRYKDQKLRALGYVRAEQQDQMCIATYIRAGVSMRHKINIREMGTVEYLVGDECPWNINPKSDMSFQEIMAVAELLESMEVTK